VLFAPEGKTLVSLDSRGRVLSWKPETGQLLRKSKVDGIQGSTRLGFSSEGKLLIAGAVGWNTTISAQDAARGKAAFTLRDSALLAVSPDGKVILSSPYPSRDFELRDCASGRPLYRYSQEEHVGHGGFLRKGQWFFTAASRNTTSEKYREPIEVRETRTGKAISRWTVSQDVTWIESMPDESTLAASLGNTISFFDAETGRLLFSFEVDQEHTYKAAISPDGMMLATTGSWGNIRLWEAASGRQWCSFQGHQGGVFSLAFSPDGRRLATGGEEILIWDVYRIDAGEKISPLDQPGLSRCWDDLREDDASLAYRSMRSLIGNPGATVKFLSSRVEPAPRVDMAQVRRWIGELGSRSFRERQKATRRILHAGEPCEKELRQALDAKPDLETTNRLRTILDNLNPVRASGERLRVFRSIQILERIGTPEALALLRKLAEGAPAARPTGAARAALSRAERCCNVQP
jgi:hypothetical protein